MAFELSTEQELLRDTVRRFLDIEAPITKVRALQEAPLGYDRETWLHGAELGLLSLLVAEGDGGVSVSGRGMSDLGIVATELGRSLFPGPVLATNLVARAIAARGSAVQRSEHIPPLVSGEKVATWALAEPDDRWGAQFVTTEAAFDGSDLIVSGTKSFVEAAPSADLFLVSARTPEGIMNLLVPANSEGIEVIPLQSLDVTRRFGEVQFGHVRVPRDWVLGNVQTGADDLESLLALAVMLQCAETIGALEETFSFTLEYAKQRRAFGRPIGSFQALKHRLADLARSLEEAKAAAAWASAAVEADAEAAEAASAAKFFVGEYGPCLVRECLQIHGGIGFTWEHNLHLYLRRVESNRAMYASPEAHLDRLATLIGI